MNSVDAIETESNNALARALYVVGVASLPVLIAGLLTLLVFVSGAVERDDGIGNKSEHAQIIHPRPADLVTDSFKLQGVIDSVPVGEVAYIVERAADGRYWPKMRLGTSPTKFTRVQHASPGPGYKYNIEVISVSTKGDAQLSQWFEIGKQSGTYTGINEIEDLRLLARVRVVRQ